MLLMEAHRQSTADIGTLAGIMARHPRTKIVERPTRKVAASVEPKPRIRFLRQWRKFRGMSQEALGAAIELTQGFVSQLEKGSTEYTGSHLAALAKALRCTEIDLLAHDPNSGESPYKLLEPLSAAERTRAINMLKAAFDKGSGE